MKFFDEYVKSDNSLEGVIKFINSEFAYITTKNEKDIYLVLGGKNINRSFENNTILFEIISKENKYIETNNLEEYKYNHYVSILLKKFNISGLAKINGIVSNNHGIAIAGVLQINSKTVYGFNKRKLPIYLFRPFSAKYPNFCVASSYKKGKKNVYSVIKFKEWNINQKNPVGTCEKIIGEVGKIKNEYNYLLDSYHLNYSNYKRKIIDQIIQDIPEYNLTEELNRVDFRTKETFSIDPPGCQDIDDAIHIEEYSNGEIEIGIHIADVSHFIKENSEIDLIAQKRLSSIYFPHKTINMLPDKFSNNICSLLPNTESLAFSLILCLDPEYQIKNFKFCKTNIFSRNAFSYQQAENILDSKPLNSIEKSLHMLYNISKKWNIIPYHRENENSKSHRIIDTMMIMINSKAAEVLYNFNPSLTIVRTHQKKYEGLDIHRNKKLNNFLQLINSESAIYQLGIEEEKIFHKGLNIKFYTHFSSPIRRYVDIIVHRLLKTFLIKEKYTPNKVLINTINDVNQKIKLVYRKQKEIDFIHNFQQQEIIEGFIIDFEPFYNKIQLYFPKYDISYTCNMFSSKLDPILNYQYSDDFCNITNIHNNKNIILKKIDAIYVGIISQMDNDNNSKKAFVTLLYDKDTTALQYLEI